MALRILNAVFTTLYMQPHELSTKYCLLYNTVTLLVMLIKIHHILDLLRNFFLRALSPVFNNMTTRHYASNVCLYLLQRIPSLYFIVRLYLMVISLFESSTVSGFYPYIM